MDRVEFDRDNTEWLELLADMLVEKMLARMQNDIKDSMEELIDKNEKFKDLFTNHIEWLWKQNKNLKKGDLDIFTPEDSRDHLFLLAQASGLIHPGDESEGSPIDN